MYHHKFQIYKYIKEQVMLSYLILYLLCIQYNYFNILNSFNNFNCIQANNLIDYQLILNNNLDHKKHNLMMYYHKFHIYKYKKEQVMLKNLILYLLCIQYNYYKILNNFNNFNCILANIYIEYQLILNNNQDHKKNNLNKKNMISREHNLFLFYKYYIK